MKIFAVGMNYAAHQQELKQLQIGERSQKAPVIFTKADSALLKPGRPFFVPDDMGRIDYESELVIRICRLGKNIPERFAHRYYDAVTVGIDFTARDMQRQASEAGLPWTICKGFDCSAAIGEWLPVIHAEDTGGTAFDYRFRLDKNGETVQQGCSMNMIHNVDQLISYISHYFTLKTGDLLYTGTPAGVGPVAIGDHLEGWIGEQRVLDLNCR